MQHKSWGFDFRRNEKLEPTSYGQYSTELFTAEAESIIANHDISKVRICFVGYYFLPCSPIQARLRNPCVCIGVETNKTVGLGYVRLYGCRPKSVCAGLCCSLRGTLAQSVMHCTSEAAYAFCVVNLYLTFKGLIKWGNSFVQSHNQAS